MIRLSLRPNTMGASNSTPKPTKTRAYIDNQNDFKEAIGWVKTYINNGAVKEAKEKLADARNAYEKLKAEATNIERQGFESQIATAQNSIDKF